MPDLTTAVFYPVLLAGCWLAAALLGLLAMRLGSARSAGFLAQARPPLRDQVTLVPAGAHRGLFVIMPLAALVSAGLASTILLGNVLRQNGLIGPYRLVGDVLVVLFLLLVPQAALILAAWASNSPQAAQGAERAVRMMCAELPLILAVLAAVALGAGAEQRFAREAQAQIDGRAELPEKSPLASRAAKRASYEALLSKVAERDRLTAKYYPDETGRISEPAPGPEAADAVLAVAKKARQDSGVRRLAGQMLRERIVRDGLTGRPAAEFWAEIDRLETQARELGSLAHLIPACRDSKARLKALAKAIAKAGPEAAVRPVVPLRFEQRLALLGAGPDENPCQEQVSQRVDALLAAGWIKATKSETGAVCACLDEKSLAGAARGSPWGQGLAAAALVLCMVVGLLCVQAKLSLSPFDSAESETELDGGVLAEYGGPLLGAWKVTRAMMTLLLPVFLGLVFMHGFRFWVPGVEVDWNGLFGAESSTEAWPALGRHALQAGLSLLKLLGPLAAMVVLRRLDLRVRADQAARFFLGPVTMLAVAALILAVASTWLGG